MSSIRLPSLALGLFFSLSLIVMSGCGDKNSQADLDPSSGKHPASWLPTGHTTAAKDHVEACTECHGSDLAGGISQVGCFSTSQTALNGFMCHASSPATNKDCSSCHGIPPNGTAAPNRANAHAAHLALAGVTCASCHAGAGSGTINHAKAASGGGSAAATVLLSDTLKAKSISTFGYDAASKTCSGIICHGGRPTPSWSIGSITVSVDCLKCHEQGPASQTPQFNSYYSGNFPLIGNTIVNLHSEHLGFNDPTSPTVRSISCTNCHNSVSLATLHFSGLTSPGFEDEAGTTIGGGSTSIRAYIPYTSTAPSGTCTSLCHGVRNWIN